jgi:hypothetical protein
MLNTTRRFHAASDSRAGGEVFSRPSESVASVRRNTDGAPPPTVMSTDHGLAGGELTLAATFFF